MRVPLAGIGEVDIGFGSEPNNHLKGCNSIAVGNAHGHSPAKGFIDPKGVEP